MSLSDLIDLKRLDNISENIKVLDREVNNIISNLEEKYNTKSHFIRLAALKKMSDKFTGWDYKTTMGVQNIVNKIDIITDILKTQDNEIMEINKRSLEMDNRIKRLEMKEYDEAI